MATQMVVESGDQVKVHLVNDEFDYGYFVSVENTDKYRIVNAELLTRDEADRLANSLRRQRDMAVLASAAQPNRVGKAMQLVASGAVRKVATGVYEVRSQTHANGLYRVRNGKCNCPDASRGHDCKHSQAVRAWERMEAA